MKSKEKQACYRFPELEPSLDESDSRRSSRKGLLEEKVRLAQEEGYQNGFKQGIDQTLLLEQTRLRPLRELLNNSKAELSQHQRYLRTAASRDAATLAIALARKLVLHETQTHTDIVMNVVRKALLKVKRQDQLKIKVHPDDCAIIREMLRQEISDETIAAKATVIPDQGIQRGGCLIETEFGIIDARFEKQFASLSQSLNDFVAAKGLPRIAQQNSAPDFEQIIEKVKSMETINTYGYVNKVVGLVVEANGPAVQLGCVCDIYGSEEDEPVSAEVLGFRDHTVLMMPLEEIRAIGPGSRVVARQDRASVNVGDHLLGRIIDGLGNPIDEQGPLEKGDSYPIYANPINPLMRQRIKQALDMGVRSINGLITIGSGQRMGIFAGSGVGKSVLMGMIARKSSADVNVIALIGERGRELNEFIEKDLGSEGLKKSVVIVATSDHLPLVRVRGAFVATAIAEYFRDQGLQVNLMMDSLTRFAMAQREIGLALGEPPTTKGYTPSVFTLMPKLLERAGTSDHSGTITGLYTVLVEGDDMNEPIADAARSILDGHIVLSRELADQNHYPAVDILRSVSRVMEDIAGLQHKHNAGRLKELLATYRKAEDLINIGAYVSGSSRKIDQAIEKIGQINSYLRQEMNESVNFETSLAQLEKIMNI
jgi:flagellum-specific ATP synthase